MSLVVTLWNKWEIIMLQISQKQKHKQSLVKIYKEMKDRRIDWQTYNQI